MVSHCFQIFFLIWLASVASRDCCLWMDPNPGQAHLRSRVPGDDPHELRQEGPAKAHLQKDYRKRDHPKSPHGPRKHNQSGYIAPEKAHLYVLDSLFRPYRVKFSRKSSPEILKPPRKPSPIRKNDRNPVWKGGTAIPPKSLTLWIHYLTKLNTPVHGPSVLRSRVSSPCRSHAPLNPLTISPAVAHHHSRTRPPIYPVELHHVSCSVSPCSSQSLTG
ncbi:hypothetical protein AWB77_02729 [Caballeronia fortuita]|uniref:Uncharacterized protein n=1 Tax=Caballeronia fortuita TaxID=1777138 RepID=A0A158BEA9_9BURK|nr:hypothetical protein AWB77_02729 [Caballeronia fortuita]